jgi:hypothetical protein
VSSLPAPSWDELVALADVVPRQDDVPAESFTAVVPDLEDELPEEERRAELRRALGGRAPEWAVELGIVKGAAAFEGETGELIRDTVTIAVFTDRGPVLRRLARHLLEHGVNRFVALGLLHGWATHFCAPVPFEHEVLGVFEQAMEDGNAA